jgi:hypothetical protein
MGWRRRRSQERNDWVGIREVLYGEVLVEPDANLDALRAITADVGAESMQQIAAWSRLRAEGVLPDPEIATQVLGVVVEIGLPQGLDLVAAYRDHRARYYNFSGAGTVWERPDDRLDARIDDVLVAGEEVIGQIGPWEGALPDPPKAGAARLSILTPGGLCFGQGPTDSLAAQPLAAPLFTAATSLMTALIALRP